jgi:hypothetical protein
VVARLRLQGDDQIAIVKADVTKACPLDGERRVQK